MHLLVTRSYYFDLSIDSFPGEDEPRQILVYGTFTFIQNRSAHTDRSVLVFTTHTPVRCAPLLAPNVSETRIQHNQLCIYTQAVIQWLVWRQQQQAVLSGHDIHNEHPQYAHVPLLDGLLFNRPDSCIVLLPLPGLRVNVVNSVF